MAKGQQRKTKEAKKPKKAKAKVPYIAGTSSPDAGKSPTFTPGKKKV